MTVPLFYKGTLTLPVHHYSVYLTVKLSSKRTKNWLKFNFPSVYVTVLWFYATTCHVNEVKTKTKCFSSPLAHFMRDWYTCWALGLNIAQYWLLKIIKIQKKKIRPITSNINLGCHISKKTTKSKQKYNEKRREKKPPKKHYFKDADTTQLTSIFYLNVWIYTSILTIQMYISIHNYICVYRMMFVC